MAEYIGADISAAGRPPCLDRQTAALRHVVQRLNRCYRELDRAWTGEDAAQVRVLIKEMTERCRRLESRLSDMEKAMAAQEGSEIV